MGIYHISGTAEARVIKFCTPVRYIKSQHMEDESSWRGVVRVTWPIVQFRHPQ